MELPGVDVGTALPHERTPESVDLELFVDQVAKAAALGPQHIGALIAAARPTWESVQDWVRPRPGRYTRSLAYRDENVEVIVLTWTRGAVAPIHNHAAQRCWMIGVRGSLELTDYRLVSGGTEPGDALIEPMGPPRYLHAGEADMRTEDADVHKVSTADGVELAVSVHVYAAPIQRCLVYDVRRRRCDEKRLRYDFIGPRRARDGFSDPAVLGGHQPEHTGVRGWLSRLARRTQEGAVDLLVPTERSGEYPLSVLASHQYGELAALSDVRLDIRSGEFVCLVGPSGCGKSTLLQALAGQLKLTSGKVRIDGTPIETASPDRLLLLSESALFPWLTVSQNIDFALQSRRVPKDERKVRISELLRAVQLDGFADALPHQLSTGMRMRVSLARALSLRPKLLLADDPFASLDLSTRRQMQEVLLKMWGAERPTIVMVTNDPTEAIALATRVVVLSPRPATVVRDFELRAPMGRDPRDPKFAQVEADLRGWMDRPAYDRGPTVH